MKVNLNSLIEILKEGNKMKSIKLLCKHCKYHPKDKNDAIEHLKAHRHLFVENEEVKKVEEDDNESIVDDILEVGAGIAISSLLGSDDSSSSPDSDIVGFEGGGGESGGGGATSDF